MSRSGSEAGIRAGGAVLATLAALACATVVFSGSAGAQQSDPEVFVNEFHYDNEGIDEGEFIEVAGPAGTDLSEYSLVLYNGVNGEEYDTRELTGEIPDEGDGFGAVELDYPSNGIQNGSPDGIALDGPDGLVQFSSYEGEFTASGGPADGVTSDDVGVEEDGETLVGDSLQLEGSGTTCGDFEWAGPEAESPGEINAGQTFGGNGAGGSCATGTGGDGGDEEEITPVHDVQGDGQESPIQGETVTIEGVVTGFDDEEGQSFDGPTFANERGIFVQEERDDYDDDPDTSEGVFVGFVEDFDRLETGDTVQVTGEVTELFGFTIIEEEEGEEPEVVTGAGDPDAPPIPEPVDIDEAEAEAQGLDDREYYETLEGMRVSSQTSVASAGGTNKFDELFLTPGAERERLIRPEEDASVFGTDADAGSGNPENPSDPRGEKSTTTVNGDMLDTVTDLEGPLAFSFSNYKVMVQEGNLPDVEDDGAPFPYQDRPADREAEFPGLREFEEDQVRVASFNVLNFFPGDGQPGNYEPEDQKRERIVGAVNDQLERPDVIGVQEINNEEILEETADELGGYEAYWFQGNDRRGDEGLDGGIASGLLVKDKVEASNVRQLGKDMTDTTGTGECSDTDDRLFDRPPLAADIETENGREFTVFVNHFSSKGAPDACRNEQGRFVRDQAEEVTNDGGEAIVLGDLNAFEDEPALEILEATGELENLWEREEPGQRYSFSFQGRLQTLDHILISGGLQEAYDDFQYAHTNVDYFERESQEDQSTTDPHALSDHDPLVLTLDDTEEEDSPGGPPDDRPGPPGDRPSPPSDRSGPPADRPGPPGDRPGPPSDRPGPPGR